MTAPALLAPGTLLRNRYEIRREIGRGGYSIVYQAYDRDVGSDVAVKLLVPPPATAHLARERLRREVHAVRGLSHGNIVAVYDLLDEEPWSYIIMEYVAGPDLAIRVREHGPLSPEEAVRVGRDIASALAAAHRRGILHRDVKPQNILLDPDGRARLTDFGSAKLDGQLGITATGALAGTLAYAAPEIVAGRRGDARADVYALGLTLYFALTGTLPGRPIGHLPTTPAPEGHRPAAVNPGVPAWLDGVVARATSASAELRYPTAAALDEALAAAAPHSGALSTTERCALCGGSDPLGLGLCPACGGAPAGAADTLVFLQPPRGRAERHAFEARLTALLPAAAGPEGQAVVRGERPLFRATLEGSRRIVTALDERHLPARSLPVARAWSAVPGTYKTMVLATAIAGFGAGAAVAPVLLWTTPLVGGLLLLGAHQTVRRPLVARPERRGELPPELEDKVVRTLAELPDGSARGLLADVTRLAHSLFARLRRTGDDRRVTPALTDLVASACAAAADLAMLDENLSRFEQQRARAASHPAGWLDALARSERARDALVQRLLEAMTVLGRLQSQATADLADEDATLAEMTRELRLEADAQAAASREIAELLAV
ncbi:MAG: serine/threonine-protein kinase [Gemmatimonadales bacterium]